MKDIYVLVHKKQVYVGQSKNAYQRYAMHLGQASMGGRSISAAWIRGLLEQRILPRLAIYDRVEDHEANRCELETITAVRDAGYDVLNRYPIVPGSPYWAERKLQKLEVKRRRAAMKRGALD